MSEHMGAVVEVWPVAADEHGIWLLSGDDAWRSGRVPADDEPHSDLDRVLDEHGTRERTRYVHSTSWRVDGPHIVLTYVAVVGTDGQPAREGWPDALPIGRALADQVGPAEAGPALEPPTPRHIDVLLHGVRHLRHLLDTDAVGAAELTGTWPEHLAAIEPALDIMYSDQREPSKLAG